MGMQTVFMVWNLASTLAFAVFAPMILARSGNDELALGSVLSAGAIGGLVGGAALSAWGGPRRRIHGALLSCFLMAIFGSVVMGLGRSLPWWLSGSFLGAFFAPFARGSSQAIWQSKVAPAVQGRVFAIRRVIAHLVMPLSRLVAGPLADNVLEPAMAVGGRLSAALGWLVGVGPGAGMALMFLGAGLVAALASLAGYLIPAVRTVEDILPDHDVVEGGWG